MKSAHATTTYLVSIVCAFFCILIYASFPHISHADYVQSFSADVSVYKDSSLEVTERIEYVFTSDRKTFTRCIPKIHAERPSSLFKERYIDVETESVQIDGEVSAYTPREDGDVVCMSVPIEAHTSTSTHVYEIRYRVLGLVSYPVNRGADMHWDIIGSNWDVPIRSVTVRVASPDGILLNERSCYRGVTGKTYSCAVANDEDGSTIFSGGVLYPYDGFFISHALNRTAIERDIRERFTDMFWYIVCGFLLVSGLVTFGILRFTGRSRLPEEDDTEVLSE